MERAFEWAAFVAFAGLALGGCAAGRVRFEAALVMKCPEGQVQVAERKPGTWEARGCGRLSICDLPDNSGAEVMCVAAGAVPAPKP